jgi:glycosyltransferase involved in cell wall biosynthesis
LREQAGASFEWLVVDGGSTDGTVELLRDSEDVACWISEPDKGIYDAWNKACEHAKGEWLIFLGAGDEFAAPDTLAAVTPHLLHDRNSSPLVHGTLTVISESGRAPIETLGVPWNRMDGRWEIGRPALPPHGAVFQHRSLFVPPPPFDLRFPIAADSHFLLRHIFRNPPRFIALPVTRAPLGGVSFRFDSAHAVAAELDAINRDLGIRVPARHRFANAIRLTAIGLLLNLPRPMSWRIADALRRLSGRSSRWSVR